VTKGESINKGENERERDVEKEGGEGERERGKSGKNYGKIFGTECFSVL